jgi:dynein heavy chain
MEAANKMTIIKLTESTYMRTLENSIQFGTPVLLENVLEELDPSLEGLLLKSTFKVAGVNSIKLGENVIECVIALSHPSLLTIVGASIPGSASAESNFFVHLSTVFRYSPDFRFYITTKLPNPHYTPVVATKVTILNFMITKEGLEDQLLGIVVAKERPEVEQERQQLVVSSAANKKALKEVEDRILHTLKNAEGNILENAEAVAVLDEAKRVSDDINAKQKIADETAGKIEELRAGYAPVAQNSSILFFAVAAMADIDPM